MHSPRDKLTEIRSAAKTASGLLQTTILQQPPFSPQKQLIIMRNDSILNKKLAFFE
jgi:hypothetical protein